ncbi:hypothetical protein STEG23_022948, partial [Scotinomys teguina]
MGTTEATPPMISKASFEKRAMLVVQRIYLTVYVLQIVEAFSVFDYSCLCGQIS